MSKQLTKIWVSTGLFLTVLMGYGQDVPDSISYQAVVRDLNGNELANQFVTVEFAIYQGSTTSDPLVFEEFHDLILTNAFGLFSAEIGGGVITGNGLYNNLHSIPWSDGPFMLEVRAAVPGSGSTQVLGTTELLTVPFAFYAQSASVAKTVQFETDGNPTNEIITDFYIELPYLYVEEGDNVFQVNVNELGLGVSQDNDASNELIVDVQIEEDTLMLVTEGPNTLTFDMSELAFATWHKTNTAIYNTTHSVGIGTASPQSTLDVQGSVSVAFEQISAGTFTMDGVSLNPNAVYYICNVTAGDIFITLPSASTCSGRIYKFRKYNPSFTSNDVSILPITGEYIDGADDYTLNLALPEFLTIISTGSEWIVVDHSHD